VDPTLPSPLPCYAPLTANAQRYPKRHASGHGGGGGGGAAARRSLKSDSNRNAEPDSKAIGRAIEELPPRHRLMHELGKYVEWIPEAKPKVSRLHSSLTQLRSKVKKRSIL